MENYNFIKFISPSPRYGVNWLTLNEENLRIGKIAYENLGRPQNVNIYIDKEKKAIKLIVDPNGRKVSLPNHAVSAVNLSKIIPVGKYLFKKDGIFVWNN